MELGIHLPDLQVVINLGLPPSVGRCKQRSGRVGRSGPGRFIIVAPRHALQFHEDSLEVYWQQPVEPARLYPSNPNIKNTHGRCLAKETDLNGMERAIPSPTDAWPEQLPQTLREIARGDHYAPEFQTGDPQQPHRNDIRDAADSRARIVQLMPGAETELLTSEITRREAARDAYPLASYFHAKQSYTILGWRESGGETLITARHAPPRESRPIIRSGATVTLQQPRVSTLGHLEYCTHAQAVAWERIVGCSIREPGGDWHDINYGAEGISEVATNLRTTATVIIIWEDWFDDANTRRDVARALRTVLCSRESVHPADIRTTHQNVQVVRDGQSSEVNRAIVIWDKVGGGLGLSKAVADNLGRYTQALLEIARQRDRDRSGNGCSGRTPRLGCTAGRPRKRRTPWVPSRLPSSRSTPARPSAVSWRPAGRRTSTGGESPGSTSRLVSTGGPPISGWRLMAPTSTPKSSR